MKKKAASLEDRLSQLLEAKPSRFSARHAFLRRNLPRMSNGCRAKKELFTEASSRYDQLSEDTKRAFAAVAEVVRAM